MAQTTNVVNLGQIQSGNSLDNVPTDQWIRKIELILYGSGGQGINLVPEGRGPYGELIHFQCRFEVERATVATPNHLIARVYNLKPETINSIKEYTRCVLKAGYQRGRYGVIFDGAVARYLKGKESAVDSFLEIQAFDSDVSHNYGVVNKTLAAGSTREDACRAAADAMNEFGTTTGDIDLGPSGKQKFIRGVPLFGNARDIMQDVVDSCKADWWIDSGKITALSREKYRQGETIVMSPRTGLVNIPQLTENGVEVMCLLNPSITLGGLIQLDSELISGIPFLPGGGVSWGQPPASATPTYFYNADALRAQLPFSAAMSRVGLYKVMMMKHTGETRGNPWYTQMTCIAVGANGKLIQTPNDASTRSLAALGSLGNG